MPKPVRIKPNGPCAIVGILLNKYYSTERERYALIDELLSYSSPEYLFATATLLGTDKGRSALGFEYGRAVEKLALWAQPADCLKVYPRLPGIHYRERLCLLKRIVMLGMALVDCQVYRQQFAGMIINTDERDLLLETLGSPALVNRLLRTDTQGPPIYLATG